MDDPTEITRRPGALRSLVGEAWGPAEVDRSWERLEQTVTRARRVRALGGAALLVVLALAGFALGRAARARQLSLERTPAARAP